MDNTYKKKLMLLGGLRYLLPVIKKAQELGYYVITCDNVPNNIAHKFSDEYCNVSILEREAVLNVAKEKKIDGILSFAVDPGVVTAAYVANQMGLPQSGPYESVKILQNKDLFRKFLEDNNFIVPKSWCFNSKEEALLFLKNKIDKSYIVKPTDSAGSKGVRKISNYFELEDALENAFNNSFLKKVIIEEFIEKKGCSSDSDSFSINGKLAIVSFSAQMFDNKADNPYTPSAYSWPSTMSKKEESDLKEEIQRLLSLLNMQTSIYNIETRVGVDGKAYIMEVSPRGGGNRLSEMLKYVTGVDLIDAVVRFAVGEKIELTQKKYDGNWAEIILHSDVDGIFKEVKIDPSVKKNVVETDLWVEKGDCVRAFRGANDSIGTLVLNFDTKEDLTDKLNNQKDWLKIIVC